MEYAIRPLEPEDEAILQEMVYQALSSTDGGAPPREILQRPEFAHYVQGWGRVGDTGFVAHDKKDGSLLGAVWLRKSDEDENAPPELAFVVKRGHRGHGIGTALLTHLVRANPHVSRILISQVAGRPVLRLYERFGFKTIEENPKAIIMGRDV